MSGDRIHIIEFRKELAHYFKDLNIAWLKKYFYVEPIDEEILSSPEHFIISKGGHIFFAEWNDEIAGTFALMKTDNKVYELAKMAVDENLQGKKIGNKMMEVAIDKGKRLGAEKLMLFSNTMLHPAIHLYRKYGFIEVPLENSEYKRSNIKMELNLTPGPSPKGEGKSHTHSIPGKSLHENSANILFSYAKRLRKEHTPAEQLLWSNLRNRKIDNLKFRRQHPIDKFIADFYCYEKLLIIELDGSVHNLKENKEYDRSRDEYFTSVGFTVLRFRNEEVLTNLSMVLQRIKQTAKKIIIQSNPDNE